MKVIAKRSLQLIVVACFVIFLASCSSEQSSESVKSKANEQVSEKTDKGTDGKKNKSEKHEHVTLKVAVHWDKDMFNERFKSKIEKKFPWITLKHVQVNTYSKEDLEKLFAKGESPDIFFTIPQENLEYFHQDYNLDPLVKKHNYDLSQINPAFLDALRARDKQNRLLSIPYEITYYTLFYNKDIFDLFGVDYPSDDMTWDDLLDLAKKVTGTRNGTQYHGLNNVGGIPLNEFPVNATDPKTGKVLITEKPEFKRYLELYQKIMDIPGNFNKHFFDDDGFVKEKTTAMHVGSAQGLNWWKDEKGLNMDVAAVPTWSDRKGYGQRSDTDIISLSINPNSKHKDAAFDVITYFTTPEYQKWSAANGIGPVGTDKSLLKNYFYTYKSTRDKNVLDGIFKNKLTTPPNPTSLWDQYVNLDIQKFQKSNKTPIEFLRDAKKEAESAIKDAKESK